MVFLKFDYNIDEAKKYLFQPIKVGAFDLENRIVMAPLTRCRAKDDLTPSDYAPEYYTQRCTSAIIISEATQICQQGQGQQNTPGIYNEDHVQGWRRVTDAVHSKGRKMILQLWHVGRQSNSFYQPNHGAPVSSSAVKANDHNYTPTGPNGDLEPQDPQTPRALEVHEIKELVQQYKKSAQLGKEAGFDGVELHSAHGYLLDQFLQDGVNRRTDEYGGSIENRARFLFEAMDAILEVWPSDRVGVRYAPSGGVYSMFDSDYPSLFTYVAKETDKRNLAYISISEPRAFAGGSPDHTSKVVNSEFIKKLVKTPILAAGGMTPESAIDMVKKGKADVIIFGRYYISNPDLPQRILQGTPFRKYERDLFYSTKTGPHGYIDYPTLSEEKDGSYRHLMVNQ